jgi:hypothetical protein
MGLSEAGVAKEIYGLTFHLTMDMKEWAAVDVPFMRQSDVDSFIDEVSYEELIGFDPDAENKNDSFAFALKAIHRFKKQDLELTSQYMGYRPLEIVKRTLQNTTQLAKAVIRHPMQCHRQSRFKHLKFPALREIVAMDTYYGLVRNVSGWVYGQIYYECTSHYSFIDKLSYEELIGFDPDAENKNDSFALTLKAIHRFKKQDLELTSQYMGYRPLEIVKRTLQNTTQLAKAVIHHPLQRHRQSRFKHLKFPTLWEIVAMDT